VKKPKGAKGRNLYEFRGRVWYERWVGERRYRADTGAEPTEDGWKEAASFRDQYETAKRIGALRTYTGAVPTFAEMAAKYSEEDMAHLAATTRADRRLHLAGTGAVLPHLGGKRLDDITAATLRQWWNAEIQGTERTNATGRKYVASLAGVFNYAVELGYIAENPVDSLRRQLSRRARSKQGREVAAQSFARPIEDREAIGRLVAEAHAEGPIAHVMVLAMLDAGLRRGEAFALRWRSVAWGSTPDDPRRHLLISATRSRDDEESAPKSGRARRVQLSGRLRAALEELFTARRPKSLDERLCGDMSGVQFLKGPWQQVIARADLPGRVPKDLRDTFGSWLVSCGVPLLYVSRQLGHSSIAVTEKHYAKWIPGGGDLYVHPPALDPGDVPADLLVRLPQSPQSPHTGDPFALPESLKSLDLH